MNIGGQAVDSVIVISPSQNSWGILFAPFITHLMFSVLQFSMYLFHFHFLPALGFFEDRGSSECPTQLPKEELGILGSQ